MPKVITANRLTDGVVVFFDRSAGWSEDLSDARVADGEDGVASLEQQVARSPKAEDVVSVYTMDVRLVDGELAPTRCGKRSASHTKRHCQSISTEPGPGKQLKCIATMTSIANSSPTETPSFVTR